MFYFVCIDVKENTIYDIMDGGPNYLGHTFVVNCDLSDEEQVKAYFMNFMHEEKIAFKRIGIYETLYDEEAISINEAKDLLKKGIE